MKTYSHPKKYCWNAYHKAGSLFWLTRPAEKMGGKNLEKLSRHTRKFFKRASCKKMRQHIAYFTKLELSENLN